MAKRMVIVSDLHLGRGGNQDDFRFNVSPAGGGLPPLRDTQFSAFTQQRLSDAPGEDITFVLNGDILDFWEIADDDELSGDTAPEAIRRNLIRPNMSSQQRRVAIDFAKRQVEMALDAHRGFVKALRNILVQPNARIVYLFGNHDHVIVNGEVQRAFRDYLEDDGNDGITAGGKLTFGHFLMDDDLGVYAEHGNQFSTGTSDVSDPTDWSEQGLGYYGLRFIWNRFQATHGIVKPTTEEALALALAIIRRKSTDEMQREVFQYLIDYFQAFKAGFVPRLVEFFILVYNIWKNNQRPETANTFFVAHVKEELDAQGTVAEPSTGAHTEPDDVIEGGIDRYLRGVVRHFREAPPPFEQLDRELHRRLFLGHTHKARDMTILPTSKNKLFDHTYLNTASWTRDQKRPFFGMVFERDGEIEATVERVG